jgi:CBS domain-containing protein
VLDVLDVMHGFGDAEGWMSLFENMGMDDDMSDVTSVQSTTSKKGNLPVNGPSMEAVKESDERLVKKLRPSKPIIASASDTVLSVTQLLRLKRGAAAILVGDEGGLCGILTDTDITRRVVAKQKNAGFTLANEVMTPDPTCVSVSDSAMDALTIMVENRFRHLPVVDESGAIVGLLDIAKCLDDAISRLEREKSKDTDVATDVLKNAVSGTANAAALQAMLGDLVAKALGTSNIPSLGSILENKESSTVFPSMTVHEAGLIMTENRKAVLVVDEDSGRLLGLFSFKDMMTRVVAKELDPMATTVEDVMTSNPDYVPPETTSLEALQLMHDNRFLTLPVCQDDGTVIGIVDVLDLIYSCGGMEGWRSLFQSSLDIADDHSTASGQSDNKSAMSKSTTVTAKKKALENEKTVEKLRPSKPLLCSTLDTVIVVAQAMQRKRSEVALLVTPDGELGGLFTDHDLNNRVLAKGLNPAFTVVSEVMTPNPIHVQSSDPAIEALVTMVKGDFRYLPVVGFDGSVVGILDIAKCLNDAITKVEKANVIDTSVDNHAIQELVNQQESSGPQAAAIKHLLQTLMSQAFGYNSIPTLRRLLSSGPVTNVEPTATIEEVSQVMAQYRKAVLVVDNDELIGIFSFKDMMTRVVTKELPPETTLVQDVMTNDPETAPPDITSLEGLQLMHDHRFMTLPVCEEDGKVVGVVDVLDLMQSFGGADGWRKMFERSMELDDVSDPGSLSKSRLTATASKGTASKKGIPRSPETPIAARLPGNIPTTLEFDDFDDRSASKLADDMSASIDALIGTFKVSDGEGHSHKVRCACRISDLVHAVAAKMLVNPKTLRLTFIDEEGDRIAITNDDDVVEALSYARRHGQQVVKLTAATGVTKSGGEMEPIVLIGAVLAVAGALAILMLRPRR